MFFALYELLISRSDVAKSFVEHPEVVIRCQSVHQEWIIRWNVRDLKILGERRGARKSWSESINMLRERNIKSHCFRDEVPWLMQHTGWDYFDDACGECTQPNKEHSMESDIHAVDNIDDFFHTLLEVS